VNRTAILPVPENGTAVAITVVVATVVVATAVDATTVVFNAVVVDLGEAAARLPRARKTSEQRISILSAAKAKRLKFRLIVEEGLVTKWKSRVIKPPIMETRGSLLGHLQTVTTCFSLGWWHGRRVIRTGSAMLLVQMQSMCTKVTQIFP